MSSYIPILIMFIFVVGFAVASLVATHLLGPRRRYEEKLSPYESGIDPIGDARVRIPIRYYMIAMIFIVFDVEAVFLYSWAVIFREMLRFGGFILIEMLAFILILVVGYIYALKKGALEWD